MSRTSHQMLSALAVVAAAVVFSLAAPRVSGQSNLPSTKNGEWPHYNGDISGSRYSPLDHINASNFNKLEVAGGSRPTISVHAPSTRWKARR